MVRVNSGQFKMSANDVNGRFKINISSKRKYKHAWWSASVMNSIAH